MSELQPGPHDRKNSSPVNSSTAVAPWPLDTGCSHGRSFQEQLVRAARVQRSLLPDISVPVGEFELASLYWPCETLGGDFYDLIWRTDCALLLIADVMGHGAEAALVTMLVKAAFLETAIMTGDPADLLTAMSARLQRLVADRVFVAAAVARLPLKGSAIQLANAGLPHPFVLRASERRVEELLVDGVPLGLSRYQEQNRTRVSGLSLAAGDVLLIGSDGIGAIESDDGQLFQDGRLRCALDGSIGHSGRDVIDRLVIEAIDFGRGHRIPDDINLVSVCRPGTGR